MILKNAFDTIKVITLFNYKIFKCNKLILLSFVGCVLLCNILCITVELMHGGSLRKCTRVIVVNRPSNCFHGNPFYFKK